MTKSTEKRDPEVYLAELFRKNNRYYLGDELKQKIVKTFGKNSAAARKILERFVEKGYVQSSKPISFGRGTFAYYPLGKSITFEDLIGLTRNRRPPLFRLLSAIKSCGGILSYYEALKITSSQLHTSKSKNPGLDQLLEEINHFDLISFQKDKHGVKYITANYIETDQVEGLVTRHFASMVIDSIFIYDILNSLESFNLVDNEHVIYRNRKSPSLGAIHNNFVWDAFAYTKTTGINTVYGSRKKVSNKQALVVLDIVISRRYETFDFEGFFGRVQVLLNHTKSERKIIPIIVYKEISQEALNTSRSLGILTYNMAAFFGTSIYEVINNTEAIKLSENVAQGLLIDPVQTIRKTLDIINETGNQFNLENLIGDFFQSLMYQLIREIYPDCTIEQSARLPAMDDYHEKIRSYEYDLVVRSANTKEIIVIELKGTMTNTTIQNGDYLTKNTLQWFFGRTLPSFTKHHASDIYKNYKIKATFLTSGRFNQEGKTFLAATNKGKLKPARIDVGYDGKKLFQLVASLGMDLLKETLERYYIRELPLGQIRMNNL